MDKIVRIDVGAPGGPRVAIQPIGEYAGLGGRAMTATVVWKEVPPDCRPLGPENKLVIAPGLLSGSRAASCGRIAVGCKSALAGDIAQANAGGMAATALGRLGYAAIIIEGRRQGDDLWQVLIGPSGVRVARADAYRMLSTGALGARLFAAHGDNIAVLGIGRAGEMGLPGAFIALTDPRGRPSRRAGRGGVGAVMGAKGIKCIVVDPGDARARTPRDPAGFRAANRRFAAGLRQSFAAGRPGADKGCHRGCVLRCGGLQTKAGLVGRLAGAFPWPLDAGDDLAAGEGLFLDAADLPGMLRTAAVATTDTAAARLSRRIVDPSAPEGPAERTRDLQVATAALDATGFCLFAALAILDRPETFQAMLDTVNNFAGLSLTAGDLAALGRNILRKESDFRRMAAAPAGAGRRLSPRAAHMRSVAVPDEDCDGVCPAF